MLDVKKCARFHSMHARTHTHIQVAIFQISFRNEAQIQYVLKETPEVMIKTGTFLNCARLHLFAPEVAPCFS